LAAIGTTIDRLMPIVIDIVKIFFAKNSIENQQSNFLAASWSESGQMICIKYMDINILSAPGAIEWE
jgi:hypothetical protein